MYDERQQFGQSGSKMKRFNSARGRMRSDASSKYINTAQKREQISTRGNDAGMMGYSLNINSNMNGQGRGY